MPRSLAARCNRSAVFSCITAMTILMAMCLCTHVAFCNDRDEMIQALRTGDAEKVQALIEHDPDLVFNRLMYSRWTPLQWAAICGFPNVVELLLAHNAFVNETDSQGLTPLHDAANFSDQEVTQMCPSSSPISHERVVRLLLAQSAFVDYPDSWGKTPLHLASKKGLKDVMQSLLASGANPNLEDGEGFTPLHCAVMGGHLDITGLLLASAANPNLKDGEGLTPLHYAVIREHLDIIGLLLANHADVNAESKEKFAGTPLEYAAASGYMEGARLLLANGADINAVNAEGDRPLCRAAGSGHTKMVSLLLANKADVNGPCGGLRTPLDEAKFKHYDDTAKLLRLHGGTSGYVRATVKKKP